MTPVFMSMLMTTATTATTTNALRNMMIDQNVTNERVEVTDDTVKTYHKDIMTLLRR